MSGHTPGPWSVAPHSSKPDERQGGEHRIYAGDDLVALTNYDTLYRNSDESTFATSEADARLIAAAPDLLEAAARVIVAEDYKANGGTSVTEQRLAWDQAVHMIRAAIAKAEGR